jgi:hypothetical protein
MPARIVSFPFAIGALFFLYLTWEHDESYSLYIIPFVVMGAILYVFSPQINWWWYSRNPPELDEPLRKVLQKTNSFYQKLSAEGKTKFRNRMALFMIGNDFMPQVVDSVPEDVKGVIAANAVQLTYGMENFLFPKFEKVVVYPKPFPSPQYPRKFHASEIFEEDGVVLFSAEQLMKSFLQPNGFYNIGLHEYAKVFKASNPDITFPDLGEDIWQKLEMISGFSEEFVTKWINLEVISPGPVSIAHFFAFPEKFKAILPDLYAAYQDIFKINPVDPDA